jgi:tetratricopeptide (TPR) repeat protein
MAECYRNLGDLNKEKESLVMSFIYDVPRPEASCQLGDLYKANKEFNKAIVWYRLALEKELDNNQGFRQEAYSTWYPHLQLCVCYWETGNQKQAVEHNNSAKVYRPNDLSVKTNEEFFKNYFKN